MLLVIIGREDVSWERAMVNISQDLGNGERARCGDEGGSVAILWRGAIFSPAGGQLDVLATMVRTAGISSLCPCVVAARNHVGSTGRVDPCCTEVVQGLSLSQ